MHNHHEHNLCDPLRITVLFGLHLPCRATHDEIGEIKERTLRERIRHHLATWTPTMNELRHLLFVARDLDELDLPTDVCTDLLWIRLARLSHGLDTTGRFITPDRLLTDLDPTHPIEAAALAILSTRTPQERTELLAAIF